MRSYGHCAPNLHRTSYHFLTTSGSNTVICIRHNVPTEIPIAITHNHPLPMLSTTFPAPLISPLSTTLLPTRSPKIASCSIDTAVPPPYTHVLLSLLLYQVSHVCVKTVSFFGRLVLHQQKHQCPYANTMRISFPRKPHHLTPYALAVSSMLFSVKTRFSNGGTTFRIHSNQHHRSNSTVLSTAWIRSSARAYHAT